MRKLFLLGMLALAITPVIAQEELPALTDMPSGEWTQVPLGEEYRCLYDTPYSFFVRPASEPTDNLMIYFEGGGACWDGFTCASRGQFASSFEVVDGEANNYTEGVFNYANEANPVGDYNTVFLPYCSGDVHTGNKEGVTLPIPSGMGITETEITVNFDGFDLAQGALEWVYENYTDPNQILVTGCSAGGYGAVHHAPFVMNQYADTRVVMLADASNGVTPITWDGLITWGSLETLPPFIDSLNGISREDYSTTVNIRDAARTFPNNTFAEFNNFIDAVQIGFYGLLGGTQVTEENFGEVAGEWSIEMLENISQLDVAVPNYYSYTAGGLNHCITGSNLAYEYNVQGVQFMDWLQSLLDDTATRSPICDISTGQCLQDPQ
jgi:hypothetical protein